MAKGNKMANKTNNKTRVVAPKPKRKANKSSPVAVNVYSRNTQPMLSTNRGQTSVAHKEVAADVIPNSSTFVVNSLFAIQPAISTYSHGLPMGKWLSGIAGEYDNYEFVSLRAHYVPVCSTLTPGLVVLTYDPNPNSNAPQTFTDARNAICSTTGPVREKVTLDLTKYVKGRKLLTRTKGVPDFALYDAGRLFVCCTAGDATAAVGYLEFEYSVRLFNPHSDTGTIVADVPYAVPQTLITTAASSGDGGVDYFGTSLATNSKTCTNFTFTILTNGGNRQGDLGLVIQSPTVVRTTALQFTSINKVVHTTTSGAGVQSFKFKRAGIYRVRVTLPGNWQNFAMFGAEMVKWLKTDNLATATPTLAVKAILDSTGATVAGYTGYAGLRGFKTVEVGGTDNDDMILEYDDLIWVQDASEPYAFSVGIRNETAVSENQVGSYTYNSAQGNLRAEIQFLGVAY